MNSREQKIEQAIENWHRGVKINMIRPEDCELHEFLGWTWEEYKKYVEEGEPPSERYDIV